MFEFRRITRDRYGSFFSAVRLVTELAAVVFCMLVFMSFTVRYEAYGALKSVQIPTSSQEQEGSIGSSEDTQQKESPESADDWKQTDMAETEVPGMDSADRNPSQKHVLALFSYTPSWTGERDIYIGLVNKMPSSIRIDFVFMDTKNIDKTLSEKITAEHVDLLLKRERYDAIIAVDDDALDFVMRYADSKFSGIPVIFNNINSRERAERTAQLSLFTGIIETFFGRQTVGAALSLYPKATRVVGISDHSLTGLGMSEEFRQIKESYPDLDFEILDMMEMGRSEIIDKFSSFSDDTILLYLNFTQDGDGNLYGMEESYHFLTKITDLPLFKPDQGGVGSGILGGCGGSYVEVGERTAQMVMDVLDGMSVSSIPVEEMDGYYLFDAALLDQYNISKSDLPADTRYVNEKKTVWDSHSQILRPVIVVMILLIIILVLLIVDRRRLGSLVNSQQKLSDAELRRRKAESRSSAITQFLSSVSHDIRTPLVSIVGYTDLALNEKDESKKEEYLKKIRSSGLLLTGLVNDTLDVSRNISGKSRMNPVITTMGQVTSSVVDTINETARKKGVHFSSSIEDADLPIRVDQMKLQKIILNLLSNAVKFTPAGGKVSLSVSHLKERVDGCNFRINVSDTGVGMSEDFQKIMYEPFVQETPDPLHMGTQNGTGLGLTIVRNHVEQMGGHIELDSQKGRGTIINAYIPIDVQDSESKTANARTVNKYDGLQGMRAMVVEDSDMNMEVVRTMLERKGIETVCVCDGYEAVEAFSSSEVNYFDVIFMDLRMPGMNGYEACQKIRSMQREDAEHIPVYALSADVYEEDIRRAMDSGMTGHIPKPVRPEALYDALLGLKKL